MATKTTTQPFVPPDRPSDGERGHFCVPCWWISTAEAKERTVGNEEEWWTMQGIDGKTVELKQYDPKGPTDKPIWMHNDGSMHLGE